MSAEIIAALADLREAVERRTQQFRRMFYALIALLAAGLLVLLLMLRVTVGNREILDLVESATTPGGQIYDRAQRNQVAALALLDCLNRRIVAHLPPPSSPDKCFAETPDSVYPRGGRP